MYYAIKIVTGGANGAATYDTDNVLRHPSLDQAIGEACGMPGTQDVFAEHGGERGDVRIARVHPDGGVDHL